ncbi:MAG: hypothetical protein KC645_07475 [Gemmatimonadetes bacterium]|nr:hypothetical protein [Gemmatimonadota bacterium]
MRRERWAPSFRHAAVALALVLPALEGCVRPRWAGAGPEPATLQVTNRGWADITVSVERGGARHRLGLAPALSDRTFRIPPEIAPPGETIALLADPVGSDAVYRSPSVQLESGLVLVWTLQDNLVQSSLRTR